MGDARATAEQWAPWTLTDLEAREAEEFVSWVLGSVRADRISSHFGTWLINRFATERAEAWRKRNGV